MTQTQRTALAASLYVLIGVTGIALGISGGAAPTTKMALGALFVVIGAIRFGRLFKQP